MDKNHLITRVADHAFTFVGEREIAVMHMGQGAYFGLNEVATRIWELTSEPVSFSELCEKLMREYEVETERCAQDVAECLKQMAAQGLVSVAAG